MFELLNYIKQELNWRETLVGAPYHLTIKQDGDLCLFKYSQIDSDFTNPIVCDARGIIIDTNEMKVVCYPFVKFFNYGERYASPIDWEMARAFQKIDGSLIKMWFYKGEWRLSTNGTIDAFKAPAFEDNSFGDYAKEVLNLTNDLDKNSTHMFELVSPYTQVVIHYPFPMTYYLGSRNNITGMEYDEPIEWLRPESYPISNIDEVVEWARNLPANQEGFVICDRDYHRIKVKSPGYLIAHRLANNGVLTNERALQLIFINEQEEYLSYFPGAAERFHEIERKYNEVKQDITNTIERAREIKRNSETKKDFALIVKDWEWGAVAFQFYNNEDITINEIMGKITVDKLMKAVERKA